MKKLHVSLKVILVIVSTVLISFALLMFYGLIQFENDQETLKIAFGYLVLSIILSFVLFFTLKNILKSG